MSYRPIEMRDGKVIIDCIWMGGIGIALVDTNVGPEVYIGEARGENKVVSARLIVIKGTPISQTQLERIMSHLNREPLNARYDHG